MNTILLGLIFIFLCVILWKVYRIEKVLLGGDEGSSSDDNRYPEAVALLNGNTEISAELIQNKLGVGYARAMRMIDVLERERYIEYGKGGSPRRILKKISTF